MNADLLPGNPRGFIGPLKPPSQDWSKRDADWERRQGMAQAYLWGRMDAGESRNVNANFAFTEAYADAYWRYDMHYTSFMPCMSRALESFEEGEL